MKHFNLKYTILFLITAMTVYMPAACPIWYSDIDGYVQYKGEHVTSNELYNLNFADIKDTNDRALVQYTMGGVYVTVHRASEQDVEYIGWGVASSDDHEALSRNYRTMMDSLLPTLNLRDTVFIEFELWRNHQEPKGEEEVVINEEGREEVVFVVSIGIPRITQHFVISSQTVVDLKRNPNGMGVVAYPSPANNYVSVKFDIKEPKSGKLQLINALGQEIASIQHKNLMEPYTFDLTKEPAGTYFVRTQIDGEYFQQKFIKE